MSAESSIQPEYKEIIRHGWSLVYNPEFKQYQEKYKNIVSTIKKIIDGEEVEGFEGEMLSLKASGKLYFTVKVDGEKFFIKKIPENHNQGGVVEFKSSQEAKKRLSDVGVEKVKIVDYIFAYSGEDVRFVVSRYDDRLHVTLASYMDQCLEKGEYAELHGLDNRFSDLKRIFKDYYDFKVQNMAYDKMTDEIILFDLNKTESFLIESDDEEL